MKIKTNITFISISLLQIALSPITITARIAVLASNLFFENKNLKETRRDILKILQKPNFSKNPDDLQKIRSLTQKIFNSSEQKILLDLIPCLDSYLIQDILNGANIRLCDEGFFYEKWKNLPHAETRSSSHEHKKKEARALENPLYKQFLFWKNEKTGSTHFQLERRPLSWKMKKWPELILHFDDYLTYRKTRKQIGPLGRSIYTEKSPILVCPKLS